MIRLAVILFFVSTPAFAGGVFDGDTIELNGQRFQLHGIDAPERRQTCTQDGTVWPCGRVAIQLLLNLLHGRVVTCTISGKDRLGLAIGV